MTNQENPSGKWWRRGPSTRYHRYYWATTNRQGQLLFLLIAMLGFVAAGVAAFHWSQMDALAHGDKMLGGIGLFCIVLGLWQLRALSR